MFELGVIVGVGLGPEAELLLSCWPMFNISMMPFKSNVSLCFWA